MNNQGERTPANGAMIAAGQIVESFQTLANNPNSKVDADNFKSVFSGLQEAIVSCYADMHQLMDRGILPSFPADGLPERGQPAIAAPEEAVRSALADEAAAGEPAAEPARDPGEEAKASGPTDEAGKNGAEPAAEVKEDAAEPAPPASGKDESKATKASARRKAPAKKKAPAKPETLLPRKGDTDEQVAERFINEYGSARVANEMVRTIKRRGRKAEWQKMIEARAREEIRSAPLTADSYVAAIAGNGKAGSSGAQSAGYKFAHIPREPIMDPEEAIGFENITCLIDGSKRTMLQRYLRTTFGMEPDEYRAHFNLRDDYPMTAEAYSKEKRDLAKQQGLGKGNAKEPEPEAKPVKSKSGKTAKSKAAPAAPAKRAKPASTNRKTRRRAA